MTFADWLEAMSPEVLSMMRSVGIQKLLCEERNKQFQLVGMYDGAMSEGCKRLCQEHYQILDALIERIRRDA